MLRHVFRCRFSVSQAQKLSAAWRRFSNSDSHIPLSTHIRNSNEQLQVSAYPRSLLKINFHSVALKMWLHKSKLIRRFFKKKFWEIGAGVYKLRLNPFREQKFTSSGNLSHTTYLLTYLLTYMFLTLSLQIVHVTVYASPFLPARRYASAVFAGLLHSTLEIFCWCAI